MMKKLIYFDNAATTFPKPNTVLKATESVLRRYCANPGRSSHRLSMRASEAVYGCRRAVASFFGAAEENVVFTSSATHAINTALKCVLRRGDHVLISDIEHNAVLRPVSTLAKRGLITFDIYRASDNPDTVIRELKAKLKPNTALVCACHHSNICNLCIPAAAAGGFCRRSGILFLLDASQSAGTVPIHVENDCIDILCAPAHKGLYGIPGCGFAVFGKELSESGMLSTFIEGGNGLNSESPYMPDFLPERLEAGTLPLPAIAALKAGIGYVNQLGTQRIFKHESMLCAIMRKLITRFPKVTVHSESDGSILLFSVENIPSEELAERLDSYGICVRAGLHCAPLAHRRLGTPSDGAVRVSFSAYNTRAEVFYFAEVLERILSGRKNKGFGR